MSNTLLFSRKTRERLMFTNATNRRAARRKPGRNRLPHAPRGNVFVLTFSEEIPRANVLEKMRQTLLKLGGNQIDSITVHAETLICRYSLDYKKVEVEKRERLILEGDTPRLVTYYARMTPEVALRAAVRSFKLVYAGNAPEAHGLPPVKRKRTTKRNVRASERGAA